tara:strand:+ start:208 stop:891 length:684 start_codon:yes stop_codon:yes gene_type:complete
MAKKLQNIKAIKQMIDGTHRTQTKNNVGMYTGNSHKKREVGETWEETINGTIYEIEQKQGFRVKKPKNSIAEEVKSYLNSFPNCKGDCTCTTPTELDKKMRTIHGMCFECVIEMEHKLRKQGKFEEYERTRIKNNAMSWLGRAEKDVQMLKDTYTKSAEFVQNAEGETETWHAKMTPEEFEKTVQTQFNEFKKKFLKNLEEKLNKVDKISYINLKQEETNENNNKNS